MSRTVVHHRLHLPQKRFDLCLLAQAYVTLCYPCVGPSMGCQIVEARMLSAHCRGLKFARETQQPASSVAPENFGRVVLRCGFAASQAKKHEARQRMYMNLNDGFGLAADTKAATLLEA